MTQTAYSGYQVVYDDEPLGEGTWPNYYNRRPTEAFIVVGWKPEVQKQRIEAVEARLEGLRQSIEDMPYLEPHYKTAIEKMSFILEGIKQDELDASGQQFPYPIMPNPYQETKLPTEYRIEKGEVIFDEV